MRNDQRAATQLKHFHRPATDFSFDQVVRHLMECILSDSVVSRAAFVVVNGEQLSVEALGYNCLRQNGESSNHTDTTADFPGNPSFHIQLKSSHADNFQPDGYQLDGYQQWLPHRLIHAILKTKEPLSFKASDRHLLFHGEQEIDCELNCETVHVRPIVLNDNVIAVVYIESLGNLDVLNQCVAQFDALWQLVILIGKQMGASSSIVSDEELVKRAIEKNDTFLNALLFYSPSIMYVKNLQGDVVLASERYKQLVDADHEPVAGSMADELHLENATEVLWDGDQQVLKESIESVESEIELKHRDGTIHTYLMAKFLLRDDSQQVLGVCTVCTDITERKQAEDVLRQQQSRLNYMAFHDSLTGLPNRSLFYDRIHHGISRAKRSNNKLVLMLLDLDRFKNINDSLGHDAGDLLLKALAQRLYEGIRDMDTVARLGGDEFVIVLEDILDMEDVNYIANKLLLNLSRPINILGHEIATTVSIGVSVFPQDGETTDELLKHADIAMYKAKEDGKNKFQYYTAGMNATAVNFLLLENDLRRAIEQDQLTLYFQPQIDLHTGSLVGVEALVRWLHPSRGLISPAHFIPLAEETGLIVPLGEWVIRAACLQQKKWLEGGKYTGRIAVNLSARQFRQQHFAECIAEILMETQLPAQYLELEITETLAMEHASETINMLKLLNQMGLSLAIDDFGTGYSSLAYLKRFPIHKLKIDRGFISDIYQDQNDAAIAKSIIGLAHNMMLNVVAEGVENDTQAEWLRQQGCDQAQGFLFSHPLPLQQFEMMFKDGVFSARKYTNKMELSV